MKPIGFIVEQKNVFHLGEETEHFEWIRFSSKLYTTKEIAEQAYTNSPYGGGTSGYNMEGRIIPVYIKDEELLQIIKKRNHE